MIVDSGYADSDDLTETQYRELSDMFFRQCRDRWFIDKETTPFSFFECITIVDEKRVYNYNIAKLIVPIEYPQDFTYTAVYRNLLYSPIHFTNTKIEVIKKCFSSNKINDIKKWAKPHILYTLASSVNIYIDTDIKDLINEFERYRPAELLIFESDKGWFMDEFVDEVVREYYNVFENKLSFVLKSEKEKWFKEIEPTLFFRDDLFTIEEAKTIFLSNKFIDTWTINNSITYNILFMIVFVRFPHHDTYERPILTMDSPWAGMRFQPDDNIQLAYVNLLNGLILDYSSNKIICAVCCVVLLVIRYRATPDVRKYINEMMKYWSDQYVHINNVWCDITPKLYREAAVKIWYGAWLPYWYNPKFAGTNRGFDQEYKKFLEIKL
jgi:hypothetical protein